MIHGRVPFLQFFFFPPFNLWSLFQENVDGELRESALSLNPF